jgi:glycosyltransferase involved in cell wall biosynthesis
MPENQTRVAWIFPSLARGYYWQPVFKQFAARYPQTVVFTGIWPGFAQGYENAFKVQMLRGVRFVTLKKRPGGSKGGYIRAPLSMLKQLAAFKPDVVFAVGFSGLTLYALLLKLLGRSRVIIFWEGCAPNSIGTSKVRGLTRRWLAQFADAGVSNAEEGARYLREVVGMPPNKILCHPCEVPDLPLLCSGRAQPDLPAFRRPVFLYVGSLITRKGWRHLLDAAGLLVRQGNSRFSVVLVGGGEQQEEMLSAIKDMGLEGIVHSVGPVAYHELGPYYRNADVFVSPTREDTWGVAVLEAMAFGKPVLCSKYAGSRQMIAHGENGFIFDPYDTEELAGYMVRFMLDPSLVERQGARSLERMLPFTPASAAGALADLAVQAS